MLNRALDILELLRKHKGGLRLSDIAELSKLNISTVHRISNILIRRGYLYKPHARGKYYIGLKFLQFTDIANNASMIRDVSQPFINKLSNETGEFTFVTILNVDEARHIAWSIPDKMYKLSIEFGTRCPLHGTAVGKIFMSSFDEDQLNRIVRTKGLKRFSEKTITDITELKKEVEIAKKRELAFDKDEYVFGFSSLAVPIKSKKGNIIAGLGIVNATSQLPQSRLQQLVPPIKACAAEIADALGIQTM